MRVLVCTADACAVGFNIPVAEFLSGRDARAASSSSGRSDPICSAAPSIAAEALRRMRGRARDPIADVLLNQRVIAGIGNVFKSEILFLAGVHPFTRVADLADADLERIVATAQTQLAANVMDRSQTLSVATGRRTTRSLDPAAKLWVYSRGGKPCRRCGAAIQSSKTGPDARLTYWCPVCQR